MQASHFVILHHRDRAGEHWDFMIEQPAALATWRLAIDPTAPDALPVQGSRIADHRKIYLEYEGPISADRGHVTRVDWGTCRVRQAGESDWHFNLAGRRLAGTFRLTKAAASENVWLLQALPEENSQPR